ncbi:hypothetical protein MMC07_000816 [Pseudocyphellaria aurata]|nr:hypothetical protein [Pseudocyphellaria aurata]
MRVLLLINWIPVLGFLLTAQTLSQSSDDIPQCWQDCLKSSDLRCICSSAPSHLSPLLTCVSSKCPAASASLTSLQANCQQSSSLRSSVEAIATDVAEPTLLVASSTSLAVIGTSTVGSSAAAATTTAKKSDGGGQGGGDGTLLDLEGGGGKREGGCLLGLTVGILAGIAWF